ncbi:MAG: hypothetical protein AMXMBFR7_28300 [Planctomycetota bacterium]
MTESPSSLWIRAAIAFALLLAAGSVRAQAPGPITWFDSFEDDNKAWSNGTPEIGKGVRPNTKALKLGKASWDANLAWVWSGKIGQFKLPGATDINKVYVGFRVFGKGIDQVRIEFNDGAKGYTYRYTSTTNDRWFDVTTPMGQARSGVTRMPNDFKLSQIKIFIVGGAGMPEVWIDDFIVTTGATPEQLWNVALAEEIKRAQLEAQADVDGFRISTKTIENAKDALRRPSGRTKPRTILPLAPGKHEAAFPALVAANVPRTEMTKAVLPEGLNLNGFAELRALLPYVLSKTESETVLLAMPAAAWKASSSASDAQRISSRCLQAGVLPIWVLPSAPAGATDAQKKGHKDFLTRVGRQLEESGAPWIDATFATQCAADKMDGADLNETGLAEVAKLAEKALKHATETIRRR